MDEQAAPHREGAAAQRVGELVIGRGEAGDAVALEGTVLDKYAGRGGCCRGRGRWRGHDGVGAGVDEEGAALVLFGRYSWWGSTEDK